MIRRLLPFLLLHALCAEDWPEWRGRGRRGVWDENGLLSVFPAGGLPVVWRTPIGAGYAGPAVAQGRVFVTEFTAGMEWAICLRERDGRILWKDQWPASYRGLDYASGPRATPTVDGNHVYILGAMGMLRCLDARTGALVWKRDFVQDFGARIPSWGTTSAPLVDGDRLIAVAGGAANAKVVALDKHTGRELWRALSSEDSEPGYSQPIMADGRLIVWHAGAVTALDPSTGRVLWEHPFRIQMNTPIATPVESGPFLFVSAFFSGARLLRHDSGELVWKRSSSSERATDGLHTLMAAPVIQDGYLYGVCSYGQLRCLRLDTGERMWESQQATVEQKRNTSAHLVRNRGRVFICNDRGELIIARLTPERYEEISRTKLIEPTSTQGSRRELGAVAWSHPAFANGHVVARNDREILRADLRAR